MSMACLCASRVEHSRMCVHAISNSEHDLFWTEICLLVSHPLLACRSTTSASGSLSTGAHGLTENPPRLPRRDRSNGWFDPSTDGGSRGDPPEPHPNHTRGAPLRHLCQPATFPLSPCCVFPGRPSSGPLPAGTRPSGTCCACSHRPRRNMQCRVYEKSCF